MEESGSDRLALKGSRYMPVTSGATALLPHLRRVPLLFTAAAVAGGGLVGGVIGAGPAAATSCTSPVKYSSSSNTIYLLTAQNWPLTSIKAACAAAPVELVDPATKTWELRGNL